MGCTQWHSLVRHGQKYSRRASSTFYYRPLPWTWPAERLTHRVARRKLAGQSEENGSFLPMYYSIHVYMLTRGFSAAVDARESSFVEVDTQADAKISEEIAIADPDASCPVVNSEKERKARLPSEEAIALVFERMKVVEQVVQVLKCGPWGEEMEKALQALSLTFSSQLVTQVLRVQFPCDVALGFFHWLKTQKEFKHTQYTYGVMLNSLGSGGHTIEMQDLLTEMKSQGHTVTPVILSCVMHWLAREGDALNVRRHWERLKQEGKKPSLGIYTAYLDLLIRMKWFTRIPHVYERMLTEECLPNSRVYALLIQHLADAGRLRAAVQILEIMQRLHVVPGSVAYEFIVEGYAKAGEAEKVEEFLMQMRERFHRPSKRLMPAVKALMEAGKMEAAAALKEEIGQEDMEHDDVKSLEDDAEESEDEESILDSVMCQWRVVTGLHVGFDVNAFAQALHTWNPAVEEALEKENVNWSSLLVLEVLRRLRTLDTSWPFFHWVRSRAGFKHDKYCCMIMIQRILKAKVPIVRTASLVDELFEGMQKDDIKFTVPMFNMMIRHYVQARDLDRALGMLNRLKEFGLDPNAASFTPLIQALARDRQGKRAMDMLGRMQEAGFQPDSATCEALITCLELAERLPDAYMHFCKIPEFGRSPTSFEYKAIMAAYSRAGNQKMALTLYEQMRGAGIKPSQHMFNEVSVILRKANREYDINTIANIRRKLKFFGGRNKALQEDLLLVLDLFMRSMKPRPNNAYKSNANTSAAAAAETTPLKVDKTDCLC